MAAKATQPQGAQPTVGEMMSVANMANFDFYKKNFGRLVVVALVQLLVIVALVAALAFAMQKINDGSRDYFLIEAKTGRLMPIPSSRDPFIGDGALLTWVNECVTQANTFNYIEYRRQFRDMQLCFTDTGWEQFLGAMSRAGSLKLATEGRMIVSANATGAAIIVNKGVRNGIHSWEIQIPILVTYQGGQGGRRVITSNQIVNLMVERVSTATNERGIGIASYVAQES